MYNHNSFEHEDIQTTLNTYSHLYPNKQNEIADMLSSLMV